MIKTFNKQLLLGLTGACLVFGYSSLLATETSRQSLSTSKDENLLPEKEDKDNVNQYLFDKTRDSYNFLEAKLNEAIKDTEITDDKTKVIKNLIVLGKNNQVNNMNENSNEQKILMVSWIDLTDKYNKHWEEHLKKHELDKIDHTTWLTVPDQVKDFCNKCKGINMDISGKMMLSLRLQQYLGLLLTLKDKKTHFVEILVKAKDIERPCTNSDISTSSCTNFDFNSLDKTSFLYTQFNKTHYLNKEKPKKLYPFTGLGYTYDWGNPKTHVGATEFIIKGNKEKPVEVEVVSIKSTEEYCQKNSLLTRANARDF
ncbi:hypothetical protein [uncultured Nostoc sp.]|uniref:hypothetical protein n=1 Tax=uncultured Nostoc sp. TaxID=340711 RepID=UPI0035C9EFCF